MSDRMEQIVLEMAYILHGVTGCEPSLAYDIVRKSRTLKCMLRSAVLGSSFEQDSICANAYVLGLELVSRRNMLGIKMTPSNIDTYYKIRLRRAM